MADGQHGGPRTPAKPAAVSGPGKYARRTDGGPAQVLSAAPDQAYGDQKAQLDAQRIAPMAGTAPMPPAASPGTSGSPDAGQTAPQFQGVGFGAASQRPDEPVTTGAPIGPGAGPEALTFQPVQQGAGTGAMTALLQRAASVDTTGILSQLLMAAQQRGA